MKNINVYDYFEKLKKNYALFVVLFLDVVLILLPFLTLNNLEGFDSAGHLASAYYIKNNFWPWPDGWNMMNLSGFPQGIFYPSAFAWLSAALSFIIPLQLSIKILVSLAVLLFPIFTFLIAKKIFKNTIIACVAAVSVCIFYFFETGLNDNMFFGLFYGMLPHLFSITFFFIYLFSLLRFLDDKKNWYLPAFLLAFCLLAHIITGSVAFIFGIVLFLLEKKDSLLRKSLLKHIILGVLLSLFWLLPFLINLQYTSGSNVSSFGSSFYAPITVFFIPFIVFASILAFRKKHQYSSFFKSIAVFNFFVILACLIGGMFLLGNIAIHFSRFLIYPFLLTPILIIYLIYDKKINWSAVNLLMVSSFVFYVFFFKIIPTGPFNTELLENIDNFYSKGRTITVGMSDNLDTRFHSTRMKIATEKQMPIFDGLFVESSVNGWFIMSLIQSWDNDVSNFVWGYGDLSEVADLSWASRIFAINYEYSVSDSRPEDIKLKASALKKKLVEERKSKNYLNATLTKDERNLSFKINKEKLLDNEKQMDFLIGKDSGQYYQAFYKINDTSLAEALSLRPLGVFDDWNKSIKKWWSTDWLKVNSDKKYEYNKPVLVYKENTSDWLLAKEDINLNIEVIDKKMDSFLVDASALEKPAPIYVKVSYFPFWKAYRENGEELKISKASPNFMLVYGNGNISFKYVRPWYYYFAYVVSGLSLLSLIFFSVFRKWFFKAKV